MTMFLVILCVIFQVIGAYRNDDVYRQRYDVIPHLFDNMYYDVFKPVVHNYLKDMSELDVNDPVCSTMLIRNGYANISITTNVTVTILDLCDQFPIINKLQGAEFSKIHHLSTNAIKTIDNMKALTMAYNYKNDSENPHYKIIDTRCWEYNMSIVMQDHKEVISNVASHPCEHVNLRYLFQEHQQLQSLNKISLFRVLIADLLVEDLGKFPKLRHLLLHYIPLTSESMEPGLLCSTPELELFSFFFSYGLLQEFPSHIFNCTEPLSITALLLKGHSITHLRMNSFRSAAGSLQQLQLTDIGLQTIHKDAFSGVNSLKVLQLTQNRLTAASDVMLPPSSQLTLLDIRYNHVDGSFRDLDLDVMQVSEKQHLRVFVKSSSGIANIKGSFCARDSNSSLEMINLAMNYLQQFSPLIIEHCSSLKLLSLSGNELMDIDNDLFRYNVNLQVLDLSYNYLTSNTSWSALLAQQQELTHLNLSWNILTVWTHGMSTNWQLEQLDLSHNQISMISLDAFRNLTQLELLSLEGNKLKEAEFLSGLSLIEAVNLANNSLSTVRLHSGMDNWQLIDVSSNEMTTLAINKRYQCSNPPCTDITIHAENNLLGHFVLSCSPNQHYALVDLSTNNLTNFSSIFPDVSNTSCVVQVMNVSWNNLGPYLTVTNKMLIQHEAILNNNNYMQHHVGTLDLTHCNICSINSRIFSIFKIDKLDLQYNELHGIMEAPNSIHPIAFPRLTDLQNNPLQCDCHMLWLKHHVENVTLESKFIATYCMHMLWQKTVLMHSVKDEMFVCRLPCLLSIQAECKHYQCFTQHQLKTSTDVVMCSGSSGNTGSSGNMGGSGNTGTSGKIAGVPSAFAQVQSQLYIKDKDIPLLTLPFMKASPLKYLNVTSCNVSSIPVEAFANTPRLKNLILSHNLIQTIPVGTFNPLLDLRLLDLSHNLLISLTGQLLRPLRYLETVYLHNNLLTSLHMDTLHILETLHALSLYGNPWECTCNASFEHWIIEHGDILEQQQDILCDGTGTRVILANVTCLQPVPNDINVVLPSTLGVILAILLAACIVIYKYHFTVSVLLYIYFPICFKRKQRDGENTACGVFAIYDNLDTHEQAYHWVEDELIPFVGQECHFVFFMDFDERPTTASICEAVTETNCAVVLLSQHFLDKKQNRWCTWMFNQVCWESHGRSYEIIFVLHRISVKDIISHDECPDNLKLLLKTHHVLDTSQRLLWPSLHYLLPDTCKEKIHMEHPIGKSF